MMKITEGKDNKKNIADFKTHNEKVTSGIRKGLFEVGKQLVKHAKADIMKKPKSGKTYYLRKVVGNKNSKFLSVGKLQKHIASAPGEAPANFTGNLKNSVNFKVRGWKQLEFGANAKSPENGAPYSRFLELGEGMAARPYLLPAITEEQKNVKTILIKSIRRELGLI